ncbi:MAG: hypothetical protein GEU90_22255 [Gemmatimonas sp.]|nr:hypothetical protein [Gemmatimonas sp.]
MLRSLDGAADVDPDPGALTLRLRHFLDRYNDTPHETLGGETPRQRFEAGRPLRFPDDERDLYRRFVVREGRKVSADHVLKVAGRLWEAPRGLSNRGVEIVRHVLDGRLWVIQEGRSIELTELDPHANATERRARATPERPGPGVPLTAATLAYRQDLLPLVDAEGGFRDDPQPTQLNDLEEEEEEE